MRSRRLLAAFLGAAVVAAALHVSVSAFIPPPRAYVGPLFWAELQSSTPGSRWLPPPSRAHLPAGSSFSSFPDRVWRSPLAGAPPNDSCHADGDPLRTHADVGPYGLQVVQYVGDWWRGLVYRPHAATLGPATEWLFGYFDFAPRAGRVAVGAHGRPGIFVGNPGACVANAITRLHGALENGKWVGTSTDVPTGRDCLASSQVVLVRMNTELRCEPDLADQNDGEFTDAFWDFMANQPVGSVPLVVPVDYQGPAPWLRRLDVGFYVLDADQEGSGGTFDLSAFSRPLYPESGDQLPAYRQYHPDAFGLSADADARNPLRATDRNGAPLDRPIEFVDGRTGDADCLEWNTSRPGERFDHTWRCGRANSSLPSNRMVEHVERVEESSYRTPAEMVDPPSTIPVAEPSRQPFPAPPGTVWAEWNSSLVRCHWQYGLLAPLDEQARDRRDYWRTLGRHANRGGPLAAALRLAYDAYRRSPDADPAISDLATFAEANAQGWDAILAYRLASQRAARASLQAGGYDVRSTSSFLVGDGGGSDCHVESRGAPHVDPFAPGQTRTGLWSRFYTFDVPGETPEYWAPDGQVFHWRGTTSPEAVAEARASAMPAGTVVDPLGSGAVAYRHFSCGTALEHGFAADAAVLTPDLNGVFDPDEVLPDARGVYNTYEKHDFQSFASSLRSVYARTTSGDMHNGQLITWNAEPMMRPTAYAVLDSRIRVNLGLTVTLGAGLAEADYRVVGLADRWLRTTETFSGYAPGTDAGNPNPSHQADTEIMETHGPLRLLGAVDVVGPGGCTLRLGSDPGDFPGSAGVASVDDPDQNLLCLISTATVPLGDCPGY